MVNVVMIKGLIKKIFKGNTSKETKIKKITNLVNPYKNRCFTKSEATKLYKFYINNNNNKYNNSYKFKSRTYIKNKNK
jgi:hypothetical protein